MAALKKIFILHGWVYSTEKWAAFTKEMQQLGFECEILSIPGLTSPIDRPWQIDDYVKWLGDKLNNEPAPILLGHSNGGRIAIAFAAKYPKILGKLILIDSAGLIDMRLKPTIKRTVFRIVAKIGKHIANSRKTRALLYKLAREKDYIEANDTMKKTMSNLIAADLSSELIKIKTPTLIIWGEDDQSTPLYQGKKMKQLIPDSHFVSLKNANHSPFVAFPEEIAMLIAKEVK